MGIQCISYKQIAYMREKMPPAGKDLPAAFWLCILYIIQDMPGADLVPPEGRIMPETAAFSLPYDRLKIPGKQRKIEYNILFVE